MSVAVVSMSKMVISKKPDDVLITYSLGSCIGVSVYDPRLHVGGLMHCMLPQSSIHPCKAEESPCMFVDTGFPVLLDGMLNAGCGKDDLVVKAAGAGCMIEDGDAFRIGERNQKALYRVLKKEGMTLAAESVGGNHARSIHFQVSTGDLTVKINEKEMKI